MKLRYLVLAGALAQAGLVHGMGLGELELQSYLGNPLQADLRIVAPGQFDQDDIRVRIARPEVYERFGARFEAFHNQIDFTVQPSPGGIRVQANSKGRVQEPFLDIVVELSWPQGTAYRRYSLLVDPPAYAARWQKTAPADRPLETAAIALAQQPPARRPAAARAAESTRQPVLAPSRAEGAHPYVVQSGDSLWKIARRLQRGSGTSIPALMDQLLAANPRAFIDGDPARLRQGVTLYLPADAAAIADVADAQPVKTAHAAVEIAPSTTRAPVTPAPVNVAPRDQTIDIQAELTSAQQAGQAAVPETLEEIRAALAQLEREKAELRQFQAQVKQDMVQVLEQRIAVSQALQQAEMRQRGLEPAAQTPSAGVVSTPSTPAAEPVAAEVAPVTLSTLLAPRKSAPPRLETATLKAQDLLQSEPAASNLLVSRSGPNLWYLLAMLPLGLLVVLLGMRSQRVHKIRQSEVLKDGELYELVFGSRRDRSRTDSPDQVRKALEQIREKAGHAEQPVAPPATAMGNPDQGVSRDELKQMIDLYMLYSQYQKAQNVILTEISKRPARTDLRLYLMQVYAAMNDWKAFDDQLEVLRRMGNAQLLEEALKLRSSAQPMQN